MPYSSRPMGAALRAVCGETSTGSKIKAGLGNRAIIDIHAANIETCLPRRTDEGRSKAGTKNASKRDTTSTVVLNGPWGEGV